MTKSPFLEIRAVNGSAIRQCDVTNSKYILVIPYLFWRCKRSRNLLSSDFNCFRKRCNQRRRPGLTQSQSMTSRRAWTSWVRPRVSVRTAIGRAQLTNGTLYFLAVEESSFLAVLSHASGRWKRIIHEIAQQKMYVFRGSKHFRNWNL